MPITGFAGLTLTSATGAKSRLTPTAARSAPIAAATCSVSDDVVDGAERSVAGVRAAAIGLEPRHVAALLVDPDQQVRPRAARSEAVSAASCSRSRDVVGEEADPAEAVLDPAQRPSRAPRSPGKLGKMQAAASRSQLGGSSAVTAARR